MNNFKKLGLGLTLGLGLVACDKQDDDMIILDELIQESIEIDITKMLPQSNKKGGSTSKNAQDSNSTYYNYALSQDNDTKMAVQSYFGTLVANNDINEMLSHYNDGQAVAEVTLNNIAFYVAFSDFQTVVSESANNYDANGDGDTNDSALISRKSIAVYGDPHGNQIKSANLFLEGWTMVEFFNTTEKVVAGSTTKVVETTSEIVTQVIDGHMITHSEGVVEEAVIEKGQSQTIITTISSVLYSDGTIEGTVVNDVQSPVNFTRKVGTGVFRTSALIHLGGELGSFSADAVVGESTEFKYIMTKTFDGQNDFANGTKVDDHFVYTFGNGAYKVIAMNHSNNKFSLKVYKKDNQTVGGVFTLSL